MIGQTISHYRILEKLGSGGMGEVYRAEDTNLSRQVAIKVLPEFFAKDTERLARFAREAKLLASLSHPNIAAIYGLEEADGQRFLIMELVEGNTLAERLSKGPLPIDEALDVCRQIAEGMEAAHEKGVMHRDLKPANIKITPEGKVKILDFGLAKALADETPTVDASQSPTITEAMTRPGVILGTAAYMSPEQAKGKPVDKRTDIWAFGCLLFECLTGRRAFEGETVSETLAAILKSEPEWQALPPATPWKVRDLLHRCLQKDPKVRLHDVADARIEIAEARVTPASVAPEAVDRESVRWRTLPWVVAAVMMLITSAVVWRSLKLPEQSPANTMRFIVPLPAPIVEIQTEFPGVAISADGRQLAYVGGYPKGHLYYRGVDELEFKAIFSFEGPAGNPFFSPDGRWIAFFADGRLRKLPVAGGPAVQLSDFLGSLAGGGNWEDDDYILFQLGYRDGIYRLPGSGGRPQKIITPDFQKGDSGVLYPQKLPGDNLILFTVFPANIVSMDDAQIAVESVGAKSERKILTGGTYGRYLPTGHLVFGHDGKLMAAPFDLAKLKITGSAVKVLDGVMMLPYSGKADFAFSNTGHLVYVPGTMLKCNDSFLLIDRNGKEELINPPRTEKESFLFSSPSLSPDGLRIAVCLGQANDDIHVYDFSNGTFPRATFEGGDERSPVWHPDNRRLAYTSEPGPKYQMIMKNLTGSASPEPIFSSENARYPSSFSPDGRVLAFEERNSKTGWDIWMGPIGSEGQPKPFLQTVYQESFPAFSPDGQWIAYQSDKSGQEQVYVVKYPDGGDEIQISQGGGTEPRWAPSGNELFYRSDEKFFAVGTVFKPTFQAGKPTILFTTDQSFGFAASPRGRSYAVMPDGQRFIFLKHSDIKPITQICVVVNWFQELKRLVPVK